LVQQQFTPAILANNILPLIDVALTEVFGFWYHIMVIVCFDFARAKSVYICMLGLFLCVHVRTNMLYNFSYFVNISFSQAICMSQ
jgi:hypothetical protein